MAGPFDDLDPVEPKIRTAEAAPAVRRSGPGAVTALLRGMTKRCPRCGSGRLFLGWFTIRDRCPRCGMRLEREEGGFLGAMVLSYLVTATLWLALLVTWLIVDLPDLHVAALTVASLGVAVLVPLLFWPFSKTIWASVDYLIYSSSPDYGSREAADRSGGNGGRP